MNSRNRNGRLLAVGDIHGCAKPLGAILDSVGLQPEDTLVVLGDFINRGPATRLVIDLLIQAAQGCELVVILGNHEEELLSARQDASARARWLSMGGIPTLESYGEGRASTVSAEELLTSCQIGREVLDNIPSAHWQFIEQAKPWWEHGNFFFTHAGYDPDLPLTEQSSMELRWLALDDWSVRPHCSGKTAIVGHTPNLAGRVIDFGFLRCLDTGCGLGGFLTAMDLGSGQVWRCAQDSEKVIWE